MPSLSTRPVTYQDPRRRRFAGSAIVQVLTLVQAWVLDNASALKMLSRELQQQVLAIYRAKGADRALRQLWEFILQSHNLSMSRGLGRLVYCGGIDEVQVFWGNDASGNLVPLDTDRLRNLDGDCNWATIKVNPHDETEA